VCDEIEKNKMDGVCSAYGLEGGVQGFDGETKGIETTGEIQE
jgi:hypothetical protein